MRNAQKILNYEFSDVNPKHYQNEIIGSATLAEKKAITYLVLYLLLLIRLEIGKKLEFQMKCMHMYWRKRRKFLSSTQFFNFNHSEFRLFAYMRNAQKVLHSKFFHENEIIGSATVADVRIILA